MEETLRSQLLDLAARFETATGASGASLGRQALNDNTFFGRVAEGQGFTVRTFDRVVGWFSDNWPVGAEWPSDIPRPAKTEDAA